MGQAGEEGGRGGKREGGGFKGGARGGNRGSSGDVGREEREVRAWGAGGVQ